MTVFGDRTVSPTYVFDAARATLALVERQAAPGVYHCVNSGHVTWADFAREAARLLGVEPQLKVVSVADVQLKAPRPRYCALSNAKLAAAGVRNASLGGCARALHLSENLELGTMKDWKLARRDRAFGGVCCPS